MIKHGNNAEAARRYHTSRQQVQCWVKRFDGTIDSLRLYSCKPWNPRPLQKLLGRTTRT